MNDYSGPVARTGHHFRIAIDLQDAREHWHLSRTLEMAARLEGCRLTFVPPAEAEVVFLSPQAAAGNTIAWPLPAAAPGPTPVLYSHEPADSPYWLARPARTRETRALLRNLLQSSEPASEPAVTPNTALAGLPFPVADFQVLLDQLKSGLDHGEPFFIRCAHGLGVVVIPEQHRVYSPIEADAAEVSACLRHAGLADIRPLSTHEAARHVMASHRVVLSLETLAWQTAMQALPVAASHALIAGHNFRLRRWPNFAVLPHQPEHLEWAALLARRPLSFAALVKRSSRGLDPVARFANACSVLGILELSSDAGGAGTGAHRAPSVPEGSRVFRRLLTRLERCA